MVAGAKRRGTHKTALLARTIFPLFCFDLIGSDRYSVASRDKVSQQEDQRLHVSKTLCRLSISIPPFLSLRDEGGPEEEAPDEGETQTGGQHLQRHGHLEQRDPAALGHHVRLCSSVCVVYTAQCVFVCVFVSLFVQHVYLAHCVCV